MTAYVDVRADTTVIESAFSLRGWLEHNSRHKMATTCGAGSPGSWGSGSTFSPLGYSPALGDPAQLPLPKGHFKKIFSFIFIENVI